MNRRDRKLLRDGAMKYAHEYLRVKRLPAGVPAMVRDYVNEIQTPTWEALRGLGPMLRPYRKPPPFLP